MEPQVILLEQRQCALPQRWVADILTTTVHRMVPCVASAVPSLRYLCQRREEERPVKRGYVHVGSGTIYAEINGAGQPLILVHGLGGSTRWWARNVPALARSCRLHVIDLLGFGRSRGQHFVLREAAGLLVHLMDQFGLARASVVGHSMGGFIAAYLATQFPERIERLVLVDAAVLPLDHLSLRHAWRIVRGLPHLPLTLLPVLCTDALRAGPVTLIRALRELLSMDIRLDLARIEAPTLILWGEHDATLPLAVGQRLHGHLPKAAFLVIAGAGHHPMWDCPTAFNQAVLQFLERGNEFTPV
jgi:pimeloyl-ACP methyl ester carboxylesterase